MTNESEQKLYTFNDRHYAKVNHTTKHLTLAKQCTVPVFSQFSLVQCAKCGRQHTVWSGRHTQIGRVTRGFVELWIGKSVDLWIRGFRETRESLKITQISVSLLNRPQSHWSDEIEKQSAMWKVISVNGKLSQSILQFLTSATHSTCFFVPCAKCETCKWQKNSIGRVLT